MLIRVSSTVLLCLVLATTALAKASDPTIDSVFVDLDLNNQPRTAHNTTR